MHIVLNGEAREVPGPLSVKALLEWLKIDPRMVAVEVDRQVIRRARYGEVVVAEGAEVEIVAFVGGGSGRAPGRRPARGWAKLAG